MNPVQNASTFLQNIGDRKILADYNRIMSKFLKNDDEIKEVEQIDEKKIQYCA